MRCNSVPAPVTDKERPANSERRALEGEMAAASRGEGEAEKLPPLRKSSELRKFSDHTVTTLDCCRKSSKVTSSPTPTSPPLELAVLWLVA